jgi:hypothetical protein
MSTFLKCADPSPRFAAGQSPFLGELRAAERKQQNFQTRMFRRHYALWVQPGVLTGLTLFCAHGARRNRLPANLIAATYLFLVGLRLLM